MKVLLSSAMAVGLILCVGSMPSSQAKAAQNDSNQPKIELVKKKHHKHHGHHGRHWRGGPGWGYGPGWGPGYYYDPYYYGGPGFRIDIPFF